MNNILIYTTCLIFIFIIGKIFIIPIKYITKLLINSMLGGIILYFINFIGTNFDFSIGINIFTSIFVGILGIPGAVLLVILRIILG